MKILYFSSFLLFVIFGCSQNPRHPQADIINRNTPLAITESSILHFADSVDLGLNFMEKRISLVYYINDISLYVEKYSSNGIPVLYKTYTENEGMSSVVNDFYFNNDSLVLVRENKKVNKQGKEILEERRTFLRNNIVFKKEIRTALSSSNLSNKPYLTVKQSEVSKENYVDHIKNLNNAIEGKDKFDLVFDSFLSSPNENYILLKSKIPNGYNANILVMQSDQFIDSLYTEPTIFRDTKLNLKWEIRNKEAIYVPVAGKITSANGLNK